MIRIQATIASEPSTGEQGYVNTFHIGHDAGYTPSTAEMDVLLGLVADFYNSPPSGSAAVGTYFGLIVEEASALLLKGYHKDGSEPGPFGAPKSQIVAAMPAQTGTLSMPAHVAAVLTLDSVGALQAPVELGSPPNVTRPMKRRRGRLYLGPLSVNASTQLTNSDVGVDPAFRTAVFAAAKRLEDAIDAIAAGNPYWGVYSRLDAQVRRLEAFSMDDRFDVMGSRKRRSHTRTRTLA